MRLSDAEDLRIAVAAARQRFDRLRMAPELKRAFTVEACATAIYGARVLARTQSRRTGKVSRARVNSPVHRSIDIEQISAMQCVTGWWRAAASATRN
ncbi:hypothetical protein NRB_44520 [Novosphingobium sp. 11B]